MKMDKKGRLCAAVLSVLLLLTACATAAPSPAETAGAARGGESCTFTDDLGRTVTAEQPRRVAVLIGSFADVWCLAGGRDSLVAAADNAWTQFDLGLGEDVVNLGGSTEIGLEALLAVEPDLVIASSHTDGNLEMLPALEQMGVCTAFFDVSTVEDYLNMLEICTQLTGCAENYTRYGTDVLAQVEQARARVDGPAPRVLYIRATGSSCKVKSSRNTVLGEMLADLGCVNIADSDAALLENLSLEAIIQADPDDIFVVLQGADDTKAREVLNATLLQNPAWATLTAVEQGRFYTMEESLYNLKPNARWGEAYEKLADILYPV